LRASSTSFASLRVRMSTVFYDWPALSRPGG
jgi:hypothetical protein